MFVQNLTPEQQSALLHLAAELIKVDGDFHEKEEQMLHLLKQQCDEGVVAQAIDMTKLAEVFTEQDAKVSLLLELTAIAHADEVLHHREIKLLKEIVSVLDIEYLYDDCQDWVKDMLLHMDKAESLMNKAKPTPFEEMLTDVKAMNYETFCKKYVGLDVGDRKLSQLYLNTMLEKVPEHNRSTFFTGFSSIFKSAKSTKEYLLEDVTTYNLTKGLLK